MKKPTILFLYVVLTASLPAPGVAEKTALKPQTLCPVLGGEIDTNVYTNYQGERIYFCCSGCKKTFLKTPEKYMKILAENGVLLQPAQEFCPVMTGHRVPCFIHRNIYVVYKREKIYFCSKDCKKSFLEDPERYLTAPGDNDVQK